MNHVLVTGQSLAVAVGGWPPLTAAQPFANKMFVGGVMPNGEGLTAWVPLVEGDAILGTKILVETMASSFANLATELSRSESGGQDGHTILVSVHGRGALPYAKLKKGTEPYAAGMAEVTAARDIAKKKGVTYAVRAVMAVHGESDHAEKNAIYEQNLLEWQKDYEADVRALTGQSEAVPFFETQMSSWTRLMKGTATSAIPAAQLAAHVASNGKIVLVGPKYHLPYTKDGVHLTNEGYRHLGEDYAKVYRRVVVEGRRWEPLRPIAITRDSAVITVKLAVPSPPIVLDAESVTDPGNYGFEFVDGGESTPAITHVDVTAPDTVKITLAAAPGIAKATSSSSNSNGANGAVTNTRRLRYAFTGNVGARSGVMTGARGNLRDSDATVSRHGYALYNWCVHFDEAVP